MAKWDPFNSNTQCCCQGNKMRFYDVESHQKTQCSHFVKYILYFMLFAVWVCSIAILGIGIWTRLADYGSAMISSLVGYHLYQLDSFILIVGGSALFVITLLGACGTKFEHKCLLGLHIGLLAFASAMLLVGGSLGYVFIGEIEESVRNRMVTTLTLNYGVDLGKSGKNRRITSAWDDVQQNFACCGVYGDANSTFSWSLYKTQSEWFKMEGGVNNMSYVPESCCGGSEEQIEICQGKVDKHIYPAVGPPVYKRNGNSTLYLTGCYDKLVGNLERVGIVIGTASITISVFMIVQLVLSIIMYRILRLKVYVID